MFRLYLVHLLVRNLNTNKRLYTRPIGRVALDFSIPATMTRRT